MKPQSRILPFPSHALAVTLPGFAGGEFLPLPASEGRVFPFLLSPVGSPAGSTTSLKGKTLFQNSGGPIIPCQLTLQGFWGIMIGAEMETEGLGAGENGSRRRWEKLPELCRLGEGGIDMSQGDYDDEGRPSWREIDRRRDRSFHVSRGRSERRAGPSQSSWLQKQYRKEAEKLFMGKRGSDKHKADHGAIYETHGSARFGEAVRTYLEEYGLPEDWSTLSLLLDYDEPTVIRESIEALRRQYGERTAVEKQGFRSKLEILAMTTRDDALREFVEDVLRSL